MIPLKKAEELNQKHKNLENNLLSKGPKAYSTAGWLGLTDQQISDTISEMKNEGFDALSRGEDGRGVIIF